MRSRARLGAGIVAVALTAGMVAWSTTSAGASGPSASGNTAVASAKAVVVTGGRQDADPIIAAAAKRFGLPAKKIEAGVIAVKVYLGQHGGKTKSGEPDFLSAGAVRVFARTVGISQARAKDVLAFILKLADSQKGKPEKPGADPVAAAAKRFGLPAKKIEAGLIAVKQYLGTQPGDAKSGEPDFLSPGAVRVFARTVGISKARAKEVLTFILKIVKDQPGKPGKPGKPGDPGKPGKPGDPGKPAPGKP